MEHFISLMQCALLRAYGTPLVASLIAVAIILLLPGCGTSSTLRGDQKTSYVIASCSSAGGMYGLIRGESAGCKVSTHGKSPGNISISFNGSQWTVAAGDDEPDS